MPVLQVLHILPTVYLINLIPFGVCWSSEQVKHMAGYGIYATYFSAIFSILNFQQGVTNMQ